MQNAIIPCEHRWQYFVAVESRAIRVRKCEHCGRRDVIPVVLAPLPARSEKRLSA